MSTDFEKMRVVGKLAAQCLEELKEIIKPGITTWDINEYVNDYVVGHQLGNSQLGYHGFPGYCCVSVNHVICHGIPCRTKYLKEGDIVKVDVTFNKDGWHGDTCETYPVGHVSTKARMVMAAAHHARHLGIEQSRAGNSVGEIGRVIQDYINSINMSVVRDFSGHGIGLQMHQPPFIPHYYEPLLTENELVLRPGMMFTIEPMINFGKADYKTLSDGWTVVTRDKSLSAQYEHSIGITDSDPIIFTSL